MSNERKREAWVWLVWIGYAVMVVLTPCWAEWLWRAVGVLP